MKTRKSFSEAAFLDRLHFQLSFQYDDAECTQILEGYRNKVQSSKAQQTGASYTRDDLYRSFHAACTEHRSGSSRLGILLNNAFVQFLCLSGIRIFMELQIFRNCDAWGVNYLNYALVINAVYFLAVMAVVRGRGVRKVPAASHLIAALVTGVILAAGILAVTGAAASLPVGRYVVYAYGILACAVYGAVFLWGSKTVLKRKQEVFVTALHGMGAVSALLFVITQIHSLTADNALLTKNLVTGSAAVYLEILLFVIVFYLCKGKREA